MRCWTPGGCVIVTRAHDEAQRVAAKVSHIGGQGALVGVIFSDEILAA